jgi:hypothetical protein
LASGFYVKDLTYEMTFDKDETFNQIVNWVTFDKTDFHDLKPNQKQEVTYHVKVPADAPAGSQYAVLFAVVNSKATSESADIKIETKVGMKIYAQVAGETRSIGKVKLAAQPTYYFNGPVDFAAQVENTGNVDFVSRHDYVVKSLTGQELFKDSVSKRVLPGTAREVSMKWDGAPAFGVFKVHSKISYLGQVQYDQEKMVIIAPVWLIIVAIVGLLLVVGLIFFLCLAIIKKVRRRKLQKSRKKK